MGIKEETTELTVHVKLYKGLKPRKSCTFPVHEYLRDCFFSEWEEKKTVFSSSLKRRFPFAEADTASLTKCPRLEASLSTVSKHSDLAFEDIGTLKDPMDRKVETLLRRGWEAASTGFKLAITTTCVFLHPRCLAFPAESQSK